MLAPGLLLLLARLAAPPSRAADVARAVAVVADGDAAGRALEQRVEKELRGQVELRLVTVSEEQLGNPIYKGRLVASLERAPLVVALGDGASEFVFSEVEQAPVYFVSALAPGSALDESRVSGELSFSPQDVLAALPEKWKAGVGLLYTPGYEKVVARIVEASKQAGVSVRRLRVARAAELPGAVRGLMGSERAVWIMGDPVLSRGAGLEYLVEQSLLESVPLIGAGPDAVARGAAYCSKGSEEALAQAASRGIAGLLASRPPSPRVELSQPGGLIFFNRKLASRFGLSPQARWQALP